MPALPPLPCTDGSGDVVLNEYGTPIVAQPEPPVQGPIQGPPSSFAEDDYGDQIIDFGKNDKRGNSANEPAVDMYDPTDPTAESDANFAADGEPLLDGVRVDELPAVKLRQELMERQLDHRGPIQTLVQRLRMTLSIENKCKQMMKQKLNQTKPSSPAVASKDDKEEDDDDDEDDEDDSPVMNPMSMASIMGVLKAPEPSGGGGEEDMEIEDDDDASGDNASGDVTPSLMPDIPLPMAPPPLMGNSAPFPSAAPPPPLAPPQPLMMAAPPPFPTMSVPPPPPFHLSSSPSLPSSMMSDPAPPPGEDLAMLGIDPESVGPSMPIKPPPALSAPATSSPLSSPFGSPESQFDGRQQQSHHQPVTGSSIFNVFFNAGKSASNGSLTGADKSEASEIRANGSGSGKHLTDLRVVDLKAELEKREMPTTGNKTVLQARLRGAMEAEGADPDQTLFD